MPARRYSKVATGGTFDGLHAGHKALLAKSFDVGEIVIIGLTSDEFARSEGKSPARSYQERKNELKAYIEATYPHRRYLVARLDDYFGPGIDKKEVQALVASPETAKRVELANELRAKSKYPPLDLVLVDWVMAEDGKPISSTRIRDGEIDAEGRSL